MKKQKPKLRFVFARSKKEIKKGRKNRKAYIVKYISGHASRADYDINNLPF